MDLSSLLSQIEELITSYFGKVLIWDERSAGLRGKYFYTDIRGTEVGIFLGFTMNTDLMRPHKCIVFVFADPKSRIKRDLIRETESLLEEMMKEIGQKDSIKINFLLVKGDLPSLVRTADIDPQNEAKTIRFFKESLQLLVKTSVSAPHPS